VNGGTFDSHSEEKISGNSASDGGGVYVDSNGVFRIVTGTMYGSNASPTTLRNTAGSGAALYKNGGTAQCGTFNGETWVSNGDLSTTNNTINVVNGELQ